MLKTIWNAIKRYFKGTPETEAEATERQIYGGP